MYSVKIIHKYFKQTDIRLTAEGSGAEATYPLVGYDEGDPEKSFCRIISVLFEIFVYVFDRLYYKTHLKINQGKEGVKGELLVPLGDPEQTILYLIYLSYLKYLCMCLTDCIIKPTKEGRGRLGTVGSRH
jgi:hypothetical protein